MKQSKKLTVNIKCTEQQALLIEFALDTLSRITCGQIHTLIDGISHMKGKCWKGAIEGETLMGYALGSKIEELIKPILFPELHKNESYGVGMKEIGEAQVAYEMVKKLQNFRTRYLKEAGVLKHEPLHYSKEPLIEIKEL